VTKWLIILFLCPQTCLAQLSQYAWSSAKNITTAQGLPSNYIDVMMQDSRGFLWFPTNNGTVRYDGIDMKKYVFDENDSNSISPNQFTGITEDKHGVIWIASETSGVYAINPVTDKIIHYRHQPGNKNSLNDDEVNGGVVADTSGIIWMGTANGLNAYDPQTKIFRQFKHKDDDSSSLICNSIWAMCADEEHNLWIATAAGVEYFNSRSGKVMKHFNDTGMFHLKQAGEIPVLVSKGINDIIWLICRNTGVYGYDIKQKKIVKKFLNNDGSIDSIRNNYINGVFQDSYGNLWINNKSGTLIKEAATGRMFNDAKVFDVNVNGGTFDLPIEDRNGNIWMATGLKGVICIDPAQKKFYSIPGDATGEDLMPALGIFTLLDIGKNRFMITTENGAYLYDTKQKQLSQFKLFYHGRELTTESFIPGSCIDNTGLLFLGTGNKIISYDTASKAIHLYLHNDNDSTTVSDFSCTAIFRDREGRYWCTIYGGGLDRFYPQTGKFKAYKVHEGKNSISTNKVRNIFQDSKGNLYVGSTGGGLIQFDPDTEIFTVYHHVPGNPETPSSDDVECFFEAKQRYIYFTTLGGGLNVFDPVTKKFRAFTVKDGFISNIHSNIIDDSHGNLWIGTYAGISRFTPPENPFDKNAKFSIRNYNINDGLPCNEFMFGAVYKDSSGFLYFGTACGKVVYFNPDELTDNSFVPPVYITGFSLFNKEVTPSDSSKFLKTAIDYTKEITLSYKENVISFTFAALNFIHPENNRYAYMLENFDKDWIYTDASKRFANYTNLDPGEYIFKVKGSNNDVVWNETPATIKLIITPPYWETWWFRFAIVFVIVTAVYALYRFRLQQILKLQSIRNKIAHDLHDNIGSTLNSISIYSEVAQQKSKEKIPELDLIGESSRKVIDAMSDIVWTINPENDSFEKIIFRMRSHTHLMMKAKNIEYTFKADEKLNELILPMQTRKNFYLIFKEAINNLLKYSQAKRASISLTQEYNQIYLLIRDDGIGFDIKNPPRGNGLNSMKHRAAEINAALKIDSEINRGTSVELNLKAK
jgi:signal transduction histidine kinase/ligand-binding sensor domain-containing protein